jgi:hypothetical protein
MWRQPRFKISDNLAEIVRELHKRNCLFFQHQVAKPKPKPKTKTAPKPKAKVSKPDGKS